MNADMSSAVVYFSSGTGNSFRLARWFFDACIARKWPAVLVPVNRADPEREIKVSPRQLVALAFPAHGLLPPWSVIKFLLRMPRKKGVPFVCLPTRGSFYLGPLLVPGAAGPGLFLPSLILLFKGYRPAGAVSFDMPVNITSLHPPLSDAHSRRIVSAAQSKFRKYSERFFLKGSLWFHRNTFYELLWSIALLWFLPLFPLLYLLLGRLWMGKTLFAGDRCTACGLCAETCPTGAIRLKGSRVKRPFWRFNCEYCLRCQNTCPNRAVNSSLIWGAMLWMLAASLSVGPWIFTRLTVFFPWLTSWRSWSVLELIGTVWYVPLVISAYFLFFLLLRLRPLAWLFARLSISHYFGPYLEPDTRVTDLTGFAPCLWREGQAADKLSDQPHRSFRAGIEPQGGEDVLRPLQGDVEGKGDCCS